MNTVVTIRRETRLEFHLDWFSLSLATDGAPAGVGRTHSSNGRRVPPTPKKGKQI